MESQLSSRFTTVKRLGRGVFALTILFLGEAAAQRGAFHGGGGAFHGGGGAFHGNVGAAQGFNWNRGLPNWNWGLPPVGPIPPLGPIRSFDHLERRFSSKQGGQDFGLGWGFPGSYDTSTSPDSYAAGYEGPTILMPYPEGPPAFVLPPQPPAQAVMHEYTWPSDGDPTAVFTIVGKDGSTHAAVAVWVQDNVLHLVTPEDAFLKLPLTSIDRQRTQRSNEERHLSLHLPGNTKVTIVH